MGAPRLIDAAALAAPSEIRTWTELMDTDDRLALHGRIASQALLGDEVVVDEEILGWAHVVLPAQPSSKDPRGYPGWIPVAQLVEWARPAATEAVVRVPASALYDSPRGTAVVTEVSFATTLPTAGPAEAGWLPVHVPGREQAAWLALSDVDTSPADPPAPAELLAAARQFLGLPYLWGGTCGLGLDCSGLVYTVFRRFGVTIPRDAHDQAATGGLQVSPDDAASGDLLFFAEPGREIHHVGIAASAGRMLHAPETGRGVVEEPLSPHRLEHLVGVLRW